MELDIQSFQKDVTAALTAEPLTAALTITNGMVIIAKTTNTGNIFFGNSAVSQSNGVIIPPGASVSFNPTDLGFSLGDQIDLNRFYIDAAVSGEGVSGFYPKKVNA